MACIMLLEDNKALADGLSAALAKDAHSVVCASTCSAALELLKREYDLYILDINLPDGNGLSFCERIKRESSRPVIFLTADDTENDMLKGFAAGCDDYISKPFSVAVLRQKILAILKRTATAQETDTFSYKGLSVDFEKMAVTSDGTDCRLTATEYRLLEYMIKNRGRVLTRAMLLQELWDAEGSFIDENTLSVHIKRLRGKTEPDAKNPVYIKTVFGIGYIFGE